MSNTFPRPLPELEQAWLALFTSLRRGEVGSGVEPGSLAAPFLSAALSGYEPGGAGTVMLVGKATSGRNTLRHADVADKYDVEIVKQRTPAVCEDHIEGYYQSAFTRFMFELSKAGREQAGLTVAPFENLIWTNLAKIGTINGNPPAAMFTTHQDALAVETILAEVASYKPRLVVFVTSSYRYGCVSRICHRLTGSKEGDGPKEGRDWSSPRRADVPAVLWTSHPERKSREWIAARIARATELLAE